MGETSSLCLTWSNFERIYRWTGRNCVIALRQMLFWMQKFMKVINIWINRGWKESVVGGRGLYKHCTLQSLNFIPEVISGIRLIHQLPVHISPLHVLPFIKKNRLYPFLKARDGKNSGVIWGSAFSSWKNRLPVQLLL